MARIDWVELRLLNWARWKLGPTLGGMGYARSNWDEGGGGGRDGYREATIPINDVEASATDDAVNGLAGELKATVIEVYTGPGGEADHLRRLVCHRSTMHARIDRAQRLLADHFLAQQDRQRVERERLDALIKSSGQRGGSFTP